MINQIAVFLENQKGRVCECCTVLKNAGINLRSMTVADTKDFGILRIITSDNKKAIESLKAAGFLVSSNDLIGIEMPDQVGSLVGVLEKLDAAGVNIEYLYSTITKDDKALILFKTAAADKVSDALKGLNVTVL